ELRGAVRVSGGTEALEGVEGGAGVERGQIGIALRDLFGELDSADGGIERHRRFVEEGRCGFKCVAAMLDARGGAFRKRAKRRAVGARSDIGEATGGDARLLGVA